MVKTGIIIGTTRPGRKADAVARWVLENAKRREDAEFELVDLKDFNLPVLDEPGLPSMGAQYQKAHTREWSKRIASYDAFVFVVPEYNHGLPGSLKNAIDYLYTEWNNKAAGIVSYGSALGARSAEQLRLVLGELQVADVRSQVMISLFTDFENFSVFKPNPMHEHNLKLMLDQLVAWGEAMKAVRTRSAATDSHKVA